VCLAIWVQPVNRSNRGQPPGTYVGCIVAGGSWSDDNYDPNNPNFNTTVDGNGSGSAGDGGVAGGGGGNAPSSGLLHRVACSLAKPLLGAASSTGLTVGAGASASAGGGVVVGGSVGGGVQVVADPHVGVAFSFSAIFPGPVVGYGAVAGGQVSVSNAHFISDLNGQALDVNASGGVGPVGVSVDVARAPGGVYSATATVGPGVGVKGAALLQNTTWVPSLLSTNCK